MYKTVGKQQRQIDDLQKTTDNHERRINTLETQGMATPPEEASKPPLPPVPTSITINNPGVAKTVSLMDYVFCPVAADKLILESSLAFAMKVRDEIMPLNGSSIKDMYMVWNLVDAREKTELYDRYEEVFEEQNLPTLKTRLPDTKRYRREGSKENNRAVFRSTLLPPDRTLLKGSRLVEFVDEISGIINL